jgi:DNA-directed RNA polymerase specialized sigma24 family protein
MKGQPGDRLRQGTTTWHTADSPFSRNEIVTADVNHAAGCGLNGYVIMALSEPVNDASDFEAAIRIESGRLFGVAYSILRDVQEAEDAVQETMAQAWRSWAALRDPEKRSAWLRRICVRRAIRMRRRILPRLWLAERKDVDRYLTPGPDPDLDRSFRRLSARQRAVVALHFEYGYTLDECAELIGCAPGTARSHLARALTSLRKELGHE